MVVSTASRRSHTASGNARQPRRVRSSREQPAYSVGSPSEHDPQAETPYKAAPSSSRAVAGRRTVKRQTTDHPPKTPNAFMRFKGAAWTEYKRTMEDSAPHMRAVDGQFNDGKGVGANAIVNEQRAAGRRTVRRDLIDQTTWAALVGEIWARVPVVWKRPWQAIAGTAADAREADIRLRLEPKYKRPMTQRPLPRKAPKEKPLLRDEMIISGVLTWDSDIGTISLHSEHGFVVWPISTPLTGSSLSFNVAPPIPLAPDVESLSEVFPRPSMLVTSIATPTASAEQDPDVDAWTDCNSSSSAIDPDCPDWTATAEHEANVGWWGGSWTT